MGSRRRPTIRDVAELSGTSLGTVSRVLNRNSSVKLDIRQRVETAAEQLGYTPNAIAQSMRTNTTRAVGFMISDISNPLFATIAKNAEEILMEAGYAMMLVNSNDMPEREIALLNMFRQRRIDALMLTISDEEDQALAKVIKQLPVPIVMMDREPSFNADVVMTDHAQGINQATKYLIGLGHKRIGLMTLSKNVFPGRNRLKGYLDALKSSGIKSDRKLIRTSNHLASEFGFHETYNLLTSSQRPTAIIVGGNILLPGVLRAIHQLKFKIPRDISLISCDDTPLTQYATPSITVVDRDLSEIGRTASKLLLQRLKGTSTNKSSQVILPTGLILRDSCAAPK